VGSWRTQKWFFPQLDHVQGHGIAKAPTTCLWIHPSDQHLVSSREADTFKQRSWVFYSTDNWNGSMKGLLSSFCYRALLAAFSPTVPGDPKSICYSIGLVNGQYCSTWMTSPGGIRAWWATCTPCSSADPGCLDSLALRERRRSSFYSLMGCSPGIKFLMMGVWWLLVWFKLRRKQHLGPCISNLVPFLSPAEPSQSCCCSNFLTHTAIPMFLCSGKLH
jgi:hypothetical protein